MNKKLIILVFLIICACYVYQEFTPTGYAVYFNGGSFESGGKIITIEKISQANAVIGVDGVKNIIGVGEKKTINEVEVTVNDIFYTDEEESRNVDLSINVLELVEPEIIEEEEEENPDECRVSSDCDDNNEATTDLCMGTPKKCVNKIFEECNTSIDCDDGNECTKDECKNKECFNTKLIDCKTSEKKAEEVTKEVVENIIETQGFFSRLIGFFRGLF